MRLKDRVAIVTSAILTDINRQSLSVPENRNGYL
jgi:hypothetical protein